MNGFEKSVADALGVGVVSCRPVAGGDINRGWRIETDGGDRFFAKSRPGASVEEFQNEAAGLNWLREAGALRVPEVFAVIEVAEEPGLIIGWIDAGGPADPIELGRGLAQVHSAGAAGFDVLAPGASGDEIRFGTASIPLRPAPADGGFGPVYGERLQDLAGQAYEAGNLTSRQRETIDLVAHRANDLAGPAESPTRIHGDLWSGNVIWSQGTPWLIDPAAHGAHREVDLAMLELFGSPGPEFFDAYQEVSPLAEGFRDRIAFWQIQPLLVHAILFGGGYGASAARSAGRYT